MKLIKKGAEGDIYTTKFGSDPAILKTRKVKPYRHPTLDNKIRKQRTIREASMLAEAKSVGIRTPLVYQVNTSDCTILMQRIDGVMVRNLDGSKLKSACMQIGKITATLHKNGIVHGDLTTSNFISKNNKIYAIDFGLAQKSVRVEDHAVDLRLFKEILGSAHVQIMDSLWKSFLSGYKSVVGLERLNKILNQLSIIEGRGRYARME
ncbi:MAG: Kae1-associated serine/threonine protein kinase [Nitrosopumilaceae archaeon]|nr:Kae1-associated serine/threonine protein kinase [Nitrososphaeria archaeon]NDB62806.1 Kae1-associated serine/threonine protein kinase [Nitrosopumilaceae archaeon]NDF35612.1 Kae1-associated serine/threonine protein kinase [Nitrosopumilaceae archaeon]